jgi:hypothetical protein
MFRFLTVALVCASFVVVQGPAASAQAQKIPRTVVSNPKLAEPYRESYANQAKLAPPVAPRHGGPAVAFRNPAVEGAEVVNRAKAAPRALAPPSLGTEARGVFVGRHGTGLGDIFEAESNDVNAQILDDVPVNVVARIGYPDDIDYFAFKATASEYIRIETIADRVFGSFLDSYIVVFDDDGSPLYSNDDGYAGSGDSFLRFVAPYTGLFYVGVTDFAGLGAPSGFDYVMNLAPADPPDILEAEPNDDFPFADAVPFPGLVFGAIESSSDLDVFTFDGFAGDALVLDVDAEIFLSSLDAVVGIYDSTGGVLFVNDDTDGLDSRFNLVLPYTGTYYLVIVNHDAVGGSSYYYSISISWQDSSLAPRATSFKFKDGLLKKVFGSGFVPSFGGAHAEVTWFPEAVTQSVPSSNAPKKPTTAVRFQPAIAVAAGDVITVVNPDGRRSNPAIVP